MPRLAVVYPPSLLTIRKCLLQVGRVRSTHPDLDQLTLINKQLEIVPTALHEDLGAHCCLEAASLVGCADQTIVIEF